jgi:hypothetical protein
VGGGHDSGMSDAGGNSIDGKGTSADVKLKILSPPLAAARRFVCVFTRGRNALQLAGRGAGGICSSIEGCSGVLGSLPSMDDGKMKFLGRVRDRPGDRKAMMREVEGVKDKRTIKVSGDRAQDSPGDHTLLNSHYIDTIS